MAVAVTVFAGLTAPPVQQAAPVTQKEILTTCGSCHEVPPPDILPRAAWQASFERMAMIRSGERQMVEVRPPSASIALPDDMQRVLRYYERMSHAQLPPPERWPAADASRFERRAMAPEDFRGVPPTIANVRLVDLGGDGRLEVVATDMRQGVVLRGRPYQSPSTLEVIASIPHPSRISMADLNSDGHSGFLVGDLGRLLPGDHLDGAVVWMRPMPGGKYVQQVLEGWPRVADVRAADFDGDGKPDLAMAAFGWRTVGRLSILENTSLLEHVIDPRPGAIDVIPVDLNRDGKLDLVALFAQQYETVVAYINKGTPAFSFDPVVL
jgi:cytochrome c553